MSLVARVDVVAELRVRAAAINRRLLAEYGAAPPRQAENPTDSLIATILSQHTADRNSHAAFSHLRERYRTWQEVAEAPREELAQTIRVAGLANLKAARIQDTLQALQREFGSMDLDFLRRLPLEEARGVLQALPGVGPKTAACVLLFSCGLPALPVDTHVHRVAGRLGLIGAGVSAARAHSELERLVPSPDVYDFHVNLIRHGRRICRARAPQCEACVLQPCCDYWRRMTRRTGEAQAHGA